MQLVLLGFPQASAPAPLEGHASSQELVHVITAVSPSSSEHGLQAFTHNAALSWNTLQKPSQLETGTARTWMKEDVCVCVCGGWGGEMHLIHLYEFSQGPDLLSVSIAAGAAGVIFTTE